MSTKFGVKVEEDSPIDSLIETAEELLAEVSVALCLGAETLSFEHLDGLIKNASQYLGAAHAALTILDNPDWRGSLLQAKSGLEAVKRLQLCLSVLTTPTDAPEKEPRISTV